MSKKPMVERFQEKFVIDEKTGCHLWHGTVTSKGYGIIWYEGRRRLATRVAYILFREIDPGEQYVLHSCDTPACVNLEHLRLGTAKDNALDMVKRGRQKEIRKTHCKYGHEFDEWNTLYEGTHRRCHACKLRREAEGRARRKKASSREIQ